MLDSFVARYGNQDIHRLRGAERLSRVEKQVFAKCLEEWMVREAEPMKGTFDTSRITDDYDDS